MQHQLQEQQPSRQHLTTMKILLFLLTILVFIGGIGLIYFTTFYSNSQLHTQALVDTRTILAAQAQATTSASPQSLYQHLTSTSPTYSDPLDGVHPSLWTIHSSTQAQCGFIHGAYHASLGAQAPYVECLDTNVSYADFVLQVQMAFTHDGIAGIIFRSSQQNYETSTSTGYVFIVTDNGYYTLASRQGIQGSVLLVFGHSSAIHTGSGQKNLFTVVAQRNTINLYANKQFLRSITDNTYTKGTLGLVAQNIYHQPVDVAFSNIQLWYL